MSLALPELFVVLVIPNTSCKRMLQDESDLNSSLVLQKEEAGPLEASAPPDGAWTQQSRAAQSQLRGRASVSPDTAL